MRSPNWLALLAVVALPGYGMAQMKTIEGTIKAVAPAAHGLTLTIKDGSKTKTETFDVSRKAKILVGDEEAALEELVPGDTAAVDLHDELGVVTRIAAAGSMSAGWTFLPLDAKANLETAYLVTKEDVLICAAQPGYALATNRTFREMLLRLEFRYPRADKISPNGGSVVVGAQMPDLQASDWFKRIPLGFEIKLAPGKSGEMFLPSNDFAVELPLGQLRDGRKVVRLRSKELPVGQWNKLEVEINEHKNVTVKLNGELVNAVAKAASVSGRVVIWPMGSELHLRNAVVKTGDKEQPLKFDQIHKP